MKKLIWFIKGFGAEILIVFLYILLINNYLGNTDKTMNADGVGYFDYLPSIFIHHDIARFDATPEQNPELYKRISKLAFYVDYKDFKVNKYPVGTAVLEFPFFLATYLTTPLNGTDMDGYQRPFQLAVFYAAIFYLFLTLVFFYKLLFLFKIKKHLILLLQILLVFSTGIVHYANAEAGFSHVYSLFAITTFSYFTKAFFITKRKKEFLIASAFLGLIIILRQVNVLIILFVPFLAGSFSAFKEGLAVLKDYKTLIISVVIIIGVFSVQGVLWYLQTGDYFVYSYQGEGFNFAKPEIVNVLFSYRKGLFVYSPILFIALFGLVFLVYKRHYYLFFSWSIFFLLLTYILSSWHSWYYGYSFGQRPYIDFYVIFFVLLALFLNGINRFFRVLVLLIAFITVPVNIIQAYQYKAFIMEWIHMDEKKYWDIFLKTDDKYKGLVWKRSFVMQYLEELSHFEPGDFKIKSGENLNIFEMDTDTLVETKNLEIIQVKLKNDFVESNNSRVVLSVTNNDNNSSYYWHAVPLIHLKETSFGEYQTGFYNFQFTPIQDTVSKTIKISFSSDNQLNSIEDVEVILLRRK